MKYLYGEFSDNQIKVNASSMHNDIHKLLLYKDTKITDTIFNSEDDFYNYFTNLLLRFGGLNELLSEPPQMVKLMSVLQAALDESRRDNYSFNIFRKLILDAHGYIDSIFEEVESCQV